MLAPVCAELHEAACAAVSSLPTAPTTQQAPLTYSRQLVNKPRRKRERNLEAERALAEQLMLTRWRVLRH